MSWNLFLLCLDLQSSYHCHVLYFLYLRNPYLVGSSQGFLEPPAPPPFTLPPSPGLVALSSPPLLDLAAQEPPAGGPGYLGCPGAQRGHAEACRMETCGASWSGLGLGLG